MKKAEEHTSSIINDILNNIPEEEVIKTEKRMAIAIKIDEAIKAKGWKKKDLASALNIENKSIISRWLSGTHNFTIDTLFDIEKVLDIKLINIETKPKVQNPSLSIKISQENDVIISNQYHQWGCNNLKTIAKYNN